MSRLAFVVLAAAGLVVPPAASSRATGSGARLGAGPDAVARAPWRRPVAGPVVAPFRYSPARPFAAGWRRGVDFEARSGAGVTAPCAGRVAYAGAVPGRGLGITLRCGRLTATVLGLGSLAVRGGRFVPAGAALGRALGRMPVRLGARVTARRLAYLDPLPLIGPSTPGPRPLAPWRGPRPRAPVLPEPPRPARPRGITAAPPGPSRAPFLAWLGAALVALGAGAGVALPRARRRRRAASAARAPVR